MNESPNLPRWSGPLSPQLKQGGLDPNCGVVRDFIDTSWDELKGGDIMSLMEFAARHSLECDMCRRYAFHDGVK